MTLKTRKNIDKANEMLFRGRCNVAAAAASCGISQAEMKSVFHEYCKYHEADWYNK